MGRLRDASLDLSHAGSASISYFKSRLGGGEAQFGPERNGTKSCTRRSDHHGDCGGFTAAIFLCPTEAGTGPRRGGDEVQCGAARCDARADRALSKPLIGTGYPIM